MWKKLKQKWGIRSNFQLIIILIVFTITGSSAAYVAEPLMDLIELEREAFHASNWGAVLYYTLRIVLILPIYQVLLILFGSLFGQFRFFWNFEKKMLKSMGLGFMFKEA